MAENDKKENESGYKQSDEEKSVVRKQADIDKANEQDVKRTQEEASSGS